MNPFNSIAKKAAWVAFRDSDKPAVYNQVMDAIDAAVQSMMDQGLAWELTEPYGWTPGSTAPKPKT